jgi:CBS domain-containing protein
VSQLRGKASSPGVELKVAGVGPLVSVLIGGVCGVVALGLVRGGLSGPLIGVLVWLAEVNLVLAVFNAIPAAPLDGGRLLHAALWKWRGDSPWASVAAARAGRVFGVLLVVFGVWQFIATDSPTALWPALLGWFLTRAASVEELQARAEKTISLLSVGDVMSRHPDTVPADISVAELIDQYIFQQHHSTFPLVQDGRIVGLVSLRLVKQVPVDARSATLVRDIAYPLDRVVVTHPDQPLASLVEQLEQSPDPRALVFDQGRLVGVVTPTDLVRATRVA